AEHLADIDLARRLPVGPLEPVVVNEDGSASAEVAFSVGNPTKRPIEVDVVCRAAGGEWRIGPDHHHMKLGSSSVTQIAFRLEREGKGFEGTFSLPEIVLEVDYLTEARRIMLGEQTRQIPLRPKKIPEAALAVKENRALLLDGKGDGVTIAPKALAIPDGPFSVEAWVRPDADRLTGVVAANFDFMLYVNRGVPVFGFDIEKTTAWIAAGPEHRLKKGEWRHLAGTYDGETLRLFIDGKQVRTAKATGSQPRAGLPLYLGAQCDQDGRPSLWLKGAIDELRISKGARYGEKGFEPGVRHEPDETTLLLMHFDGGFGPFAPDHSASGAHGCRLGGVRYVPVKRVKAPAKD
ncbi:MAG: LamG domain-containing protein, partial [Planctomycetota bacterium]